MSRHKKNERKLSTKQIVLAMLQVAQTTFRASPLAIIVQVAGSIISAVLPIATTYFAALTTTALADAYAGNEQAGERVIVYVIVTALLGVFMTVWSSMESYLRQLTRYKVEAAMTDRMYEQFHAIDFWRYDDKETADLYEKARQFANFFPYVFDQLTRILTDALTMLAGLIALGLVNIWLAVFVALAIVPGMLIQLSLSRASAKHWRQNVDTRRAKNLIEWNILRPQFMAEMRLYGVVRSLLDLRMKLREKDEKTRIEFEKKYLLRRLGGDVLEAAAEVVALIWITIQITHRTQPIGQFIYVQQIVSRAIGGANSLISTISAMDEDLANLYDYQEFMNLPVGQESAQKLASMPHVIRVENVSFHYPSKKKPVLENVSFEIPAGSRVAIVGENGAGKSTLIKLLTGLYAPSKGRILLDDVDLHDIDITTWHAKLGVLQQDFIMYDFATAKDNVLYGDVTRKYNAKRFEHALEKAEAKKFISELPHGAATYIHPWMEDDDGNDGQMLSGGQQQRLALARNFYRDSPAIILDEPTSAIDALAESRIFDHLFASKDKTIITISHRVTTIEKADIIYMFEHGKIVEHGTHRELVARKGAYYRMFKSQLHE